MHAAALPWANPYTRCCAARVTSRDRALSSFPPECRHDECPSSRGHRKALESVTLDDKYALESGRAFMSGVQALVRLPMLQRKRDAMFGLNTAGFISGYRGSPLGGYDQALWAAKKHLAAQNIVFQPGVNEELGGDRGLGHAAARPLSADEEVRRRVRHLVRQGPGRRPLLRRLQARQHGRHRRSTAA